MIWRQLLVMKRWFGPLVIMLAVLPLGCAQQTSPQCTYVAQVDNDSHVDRYECSGIGTGTSTLIKIAKNRPNSELWVLEELENEQSTATPQTPTGVGFSGKHLDESTFQTRSNALVQMNGYTFSCNANDPNDRSKTCYWWGSAYPTTTVYESTKRLSSFGLTPNPDEGLTGQHMLTFKPRTLGPLMEVSGEGVIPGNEIDLH